MEFCFKNSISFYIHNCSIHSSIYHALYTFKIQSSDFVTTETGVEFPLILPVARLFMGDLGEAGADEVTVTPPDVTAVEP